VSPDRTRPESRAHAQMEIIRQRFHGVAEEGPIGHEETGVKYWVRRGFVLVRDEYADRVRRMVFPRDRPEPQEQPERPEGQPRDRDVVYGMQYVGLPPGLSALEAVRLINARMPGVATTEKLIHITPSTGGGCPATEPTPVPPGTPPDPPVSTDRRAGRGVRVVVIDTGLDRRIARLLPWMRGVRGDPDLGVRPKKPLAPYAGHGTFIAGVVRTMAPRARVVVRNGLPYDGCNWERNLLDLLARSLVEDQPDVISLSAGTLSDDRLALFEGFHREVLSHYKGVAIVAAAGNDGWSQCFWPAASSWTTSVGALADDWHRRARFTNHGGWVDVYAPGQHLVNAYPAGWFQYREPKNYQKVAVFEGMARWSGTSFATPVVAGLIAARMSRTGENGTDAAAALIRRARKRAVRGVGAVLIP
jgi:subtilisin family serine protease